MQTQKLSSYIMTRTVYQTNTHAHYEVYSLSHCVVKFASDRSVVFYWYSCFLHQ